MLTRPPTSSIPHHQTHNPLCVPDMQIAYAALRMLVSLIRYLGCSGLVKHTSACLSVPSGPLTRGNFRSIKLVGPREIDIAYGAASCLSIPYAYL